MHSDKEFTPREISEREKEKSPLDLFVEVSGADESIRKEFDKTFKDLKLPAGAFEAGNAIRMFLIDNGWTYDARVFLIQDMLKEKRGNCLGLTMLLGAALGREGFEVYYEIITGVRDAYYRAENRYFERLMRGDEFDYDNPTLPTKQNENAVASFLPLEHPIPILGGRPFETTNLEDRESYPDWEPEGERVVPASYKDVASHVLIDRARALLSSDPKGAEKFCAAGLSLSPSNREGQYIRLLLSKASGDKGETDKLLKEYLALGDNDSRYLFNVYGLTGDKAFLDKALEKCPTHLHAFMEKFVRNESDDREAKFNFSVAAWCASSSKTIGLNEFYSIFSDELKRLFGEKGLERYKSLQSYLK